MPQSHICPSCLTELGRIRAVPDPHYRLPVVVCTSCGRAGVRTRHPDIEFWREFRRVRHALQLVFAKLLLTILAGLTFWGLVLASEPLFTPRKGMFDPVYPFYSGDPDLLIGTGLVFSGVVLLTMMVSMLRWRRSIFFGAGLFLVVSVFFTTMEYLSNGFAELLAWVGGYDGGYAGIDWARIMRMVYLGLISMFGLIPAILTRRLVDRGDTRRFRRLLKKRRKQRTNND